MDQYRLKPLVVAIRAALYGGHWVPINQMYQQGIL